MNMRTGAVVLAAALLAIAFPPQSEAAKQKGNKDDAKNVTIHVICDDFFKLYVNGKWIGQNRISGRWLDAFSFSTQLSDGDVIGVDAQDAFGNRGLYVFVEADDDRSSFGSDATWEYAESPHINWERALNERHGWKPCNVIENEALLKNAPDRERALVIWGDKSYCLVRKIVDFEQTGVQRAPRPSARQSASAARARMLRANGEKITEGMRLADVKQLVGAPDVEMGFTGSAAQRRQCLYCEGPVLLSVWIENALVRRVRMVEVDPEAYEHTRATPDEPALFAGLRKVRKGLGADTVLQHLGKPASVRQVNRNFRHQTSHGHRCRIWFENGVVVSVRTDIDESRTEE